MREFWAQIAELSSGIYSIWRREMLSLFVTPVAYLVAALFLLHQGWNFALLLHVLNDPLAAPGPVMQFYFGGSFLIFWLPVLFVCATISMRLLAEERRLGTLEGLLTAPVRPFQIVVGKYLAALSYYLCLWLPTFSFYLLLRSAMPPELPGPDVGPIVAGYVGTLLVGASFLAIGTFSSALARSQLSAAVGAFVMSSGLLLSGLMAEQVDSSKLSAALQWGSVLRMMQEMAQGIVDGHWIYLHLSLVFLFLLAAIVVIDGRKDWQTWLQSGCMGVTVLCAGLWLGRHSDRGDWTEAKMYSLSDQAQTILSSLDKPVEVVVAIPKVAGPGQSNPLRGELLEVLARMQRYSPNLRLRAIDPDQDQQQALRLYSEFGTGGPAVRDGVVLIRAGAGASLKRDVILPGELVSYARGPEVQRTGPRIAEFRGEAALLRAFLAVSAERKARICYTQGHGEPAFDSLEPYRGYANLRDLLRDANFEVVTADFNATDSAAPRSSPPKRETPEREEDAHPKRPLFERCDLILVAGPSLTFSKAEADKLGAWLKGGGSLLVLAGAVIHRGQASLSPHGLEPLLREYGIDYKERVVIDLKHRMAAESPGIAFTLDRGWGDHEAVVNLVRRPVSMQLVRELSLRPPAVPLLSTDEAAFAHAQVQDLSALESLRFDEAQDRKGPIPIAAAAQRGRTRVVVLASDQFALNARLRPDVVYDHGRDLILNTVGWLTQHGELLGIQSREREHIKLVLAPDQLRKMTWVSVLGLPLFAVFLGVWVLWRRRT